MLLYKVAAIFFWDLGDHWCSVQRRSVDLLHDRSDSVLGAQWYHWRAAQNPV